MKKVVSVFISLCILMSMALFSSAAADGTGLYPASVIRSDGEKWGYINGSGSFVIKPEYDFALGFNDSGIAIAAKGAYSFEECSVVFIDKNGKTVAGPFNSAVPEFINGMAILRGKDYGSKVFDESGKLLLVSSFAVFDYNEGLLRYSRKPADGKELYGFMDISGKSVIPAVYTYADSFSNGLSRVSLADGSYEVIDRTGAVIETSKQYIGYYGQSEGLSIFRDEATEKYGYKSQDGENGLIDKKSEYILNTEYSGITRLGGGLFAVSNSFYTFNDHFAAKAIFDGKGNRLTDFMYYSVNPFKDNIASACDDTTTFFIGTDGKKVSNLPVVQGIGVMTRLGGVIKAETDGGLQYLRADGSLIWKKDETIPLDGGIRVKQLKYRKDFCTIVEYPEIQGMKDGNKQKSVNSKLKSLFTDGLQDSRGEDGYTEEVNITFTVEKNKDLLIIEESGYFYSIGAAHPQSSRTYHYIDLKSGAFYKLADLFKSGSKFYDRLAALVQKQIELDLKTNKVVDNFYYFVEKPTVNKDQGFIIGSDSISIYYYSGEISAYAFGFPEFEIPYGQLTDYINTGGAFWKSFNKQIVNSKVKFSYDVDQKTGNTILNTLKAYESGIVDAINLNSFSKVEGTLVKGSSLYNSQKWLVNNLYKKGIKEKLMKYEAYMVSYDYANKVYRIFVLEDVAVKYPGKSYVTSRYNWCYTAVYDEKTGTVRLSNIVKW